MRRLPQGVFETQYRFADGTVVDAVIRLGGSLVPAENVYYEAVMRGDEAGALYALAYGLKGLQVEKQAASVREGLTHLAVDMERIRDPLTRLGTQLRHSQNNYEQLRRALDRFGDRLGGLGCVLLPEENEEALPPAAQTDS